MGVIRPTGDDVRVAAETLNALDAGGTLSVGQQPLPGWTVEALRPALEIVATGKAAWWDVGEFAPDEERPKCAGCGEPVDLGDAADPESWVHAADANYFGDHSAWV